MQLFSLSVFAILILIQITELNYFKKSRIAHESK